MSKKTDTDRQLKTVRDWHVYHVYNDPDFYKTVQAIIGKEKPLVAWKNETEEFKKLAKAFAIDSGDIKYFLLLKILPLRKRPSPKGFGQLGFNHKTGQFTITFSPDISQKEFMELWQEFDKARRTLGQPKLPKRRLPENLDLLYAIFKARQIEKRSERLSFKEIFSLYSERRLAGYKGSSTQFSSEDDLEEYYHMYYPKNKPLDKF